MSQEPTDPQPGQEPTPPAGQPQPGQEPEPQTFDADYVKKLRDEAASWRTKAQENASKVEEFENANKSEQQKLADRAAQAEREAQEASSRLLRYEVAAAAGVPIGDAHRLVGSTKEELEKDAEALAKRLGASTPPPDFGGGPRQPAPTDDFDSLIRQRAGQA